MDRGFSIEETDDGLFILRHGEVEMRLTEQEPLGLKAKVNLWADCILSQYQARSGHVSSIACVLIAQAAVWPDAIQENILLALTSPSGSREVSRFQSQSLGSDLWRCRTF
jgi:hypothetical protein